MRINLATPVIPGLDIGEQHAFWKDVVGFTTTGEFPHFVTMELDGLPIYLSEVEEDVIPTNNLLWLQVDDLEAWRGRLIKRGVGRKWSEAGPAVTKITEQPWGRDFALRDPSGNCVHFYAAAA